MLNALRCITFTDPTAYNPSLMHFVTCMPVAPALSRSQLPFSVSSDLPHFCLAPPPFIRVQINPDAHNVCTRAKNHYEPQQVHRLFSPDMAGTEDNADQAVAQSDNHSEFQNTFQQAHERQARRMYFV